MSWTDPRERTTAPRSCSVFVGTDEHRPWRVSRTTNALARRVLGFSADRRLFHLRFRDRGRAAQAYARFLSVDPTADITCTYSKCPRPPFSHAWGARTARPIAARRFSLAVSTAPWGLRSRCPRSQVVVTGRQR